MTFYPGSMVVYQVDSKVRMPVGQNLKGRGIGFLEKDISM